MSDLSENYSAIPWKWKDVGYHILEDSDGNSILQTYSKPSAPDAALIKASPYLLKGCKMALDFFMQRDHR